VAVKQVLLAVLAHPDDETFGMGGTLALYAQRGAAVHLVCATRGEAGEADAAYLRGFSSIAELREHELGCAARQLGLAGVHFLNYRDSGMPGAKDNQHPKALINAPLDELAGKVVGCIRQLCPQVVLTHDPMGGYGHPDHIHLQQAVVKAFYTASDPAAYPESLPVYAPQKLYFNTISRRMMRWIVRLMPLVGKDPRRFGNNGDIDMKAIAAVDFPTHASINYAAVKKIRLQASQCYASQGGQQTNKGVAGLLRGWERSNEIFMLAYPQPEPGYVEKDLFAGVKPDSLP
jgi:LmbE family N-acetylglucosaminyl deacetylase